MPYDGKVSLKVYDMTGREVLSLVNDFKTAGFYSVNFSSSEKAGLSIGVYVYRLSAGDFSQSKKMILVKLVFRLIVFYCLIRAVRFEI